MLTVADYRSLVETLLYVRPQILLLDIDLPNLNGQKGVATLRSLNSVTKIIAVCRSITDDTELALFKSGGIRACCRTDTDSHDLKRIIVAVQAGELWIRRSLTLRLLDDVGAIELEEVRPSKCLDAGRLVALTQREREIALLVGDGNSNKLIARRLDITERTVKAHLTEIFRKLGIHDRLMLALRVVTSNTSNESERASAA
jgi:two-component system NarL family response regulator